MYDFEILLWSHIQNVRIELLISSKGVATTAQGLIKYCDWPLPLRIHEIPAHSVKQAWLVLFLIYSSVDSFIESLLTWAIFHWDCRLLLVQTVTSSPPSLSLPRCLDHVAAHPFDSLTSHSYVFSLEQLICSSRNYVSWFFVRPPSSPPDFMALRWWLFD